LYINQFLHKFYHSFPIGKRNDLFSVSTGKTAETTEKGTGEQHSLLFFLKKRMKHTFFDAFFRSLGIILPEIRQHFYYNTTETIIPVNFNENLTLSKKSFPPRK
jgi:hypothetical protein